MKENNSYRKNKFEFLEAKKYKTAAKPMLTYTKEK